MTSAADMLAAGFITPAFLGAGAVLASIPIIIHLLNRRRFKTVPWAAMNFLLRAMRKNRRRNRFEQWLLLATRCAVLLFLGLALARPLGCEDSSLASLAGRRNGLHVIVIDNSYSTMYEADRPDAKTHLDQAKLLAKRLVDRFSTGGESVAIITAAKPAAAVISAPIFDPQAAKSAIDRIEQSFGGTDIAGALQLAEKIAADQSRQPSRSLYLLSDSTRSAWLASGQEQALATAGRNLAKTYQSIAYFDLARPNQWNAAVAEIRPGNNLLRIGYQNDLVATVRGYGPAREGQLQWRMDDQTLPAGQTILAQPDSPPITHPLTQLPRGGTHVVAVSLSAEDRLKIDDTRNRVIDIASETKVLIVEGERSAESFGGSGSLVMEALAPRVDRGPAATRASSYLAPELVADLEFGNNIISDYRAIVLAGVGQISESQADQLKRFVESGGTLFIFMGEAVTAERYNSLLLSRGLLPGPLAKRVNSAGGREPFFLDFKPNAQLHPLLKKFANATNSGLERAPIFTYWQIDLAAEGKAERVLNFQPSAESADKRADAAIVTHSLGSGHVVTFATSANLDWTALPGRLNFAPLLHELLSGTMTSGDAWMNLNVGDSLNVPSSVQFTAAPTLVDSQQAEVTIAQITDDSGRTSYRSRPLARPGVYTLSTGTAKLPIAVNVPADEADIRTIDNAAIRKVLGDIEIDFATDQLPATTELAQAGNDFGWTFMLIVLGLVAFECFLAMRFGHYRK